MELSIIVAAAENNVIGRDNGLIWHLSADLKRFKELTTGNTIVMGRKTFMSIGKPLPKRRNLIISHNPDFQAAGCEVFHSIEAVLENVKNENKVFIIGGGSVYKTLWDKVDKLYLTRVHVDVEGDTRIPEIDLTKWKVLSVQSFPADEKNEYNYSFIDYQRI